MNQKKYNRHKMDKFAREAEQSLGNFTGQQKGSFENGSFVKPVKMPRNPVQSGSYTAGTGTEYSNMTGAQANEAPVVAQTPKGGLVQLGTIDTNNSFFTFVIRNKNTTEKKTAVLFGAAHNVSKNNFGNDDDIALEFEEEEYLALLHTIISSPVLFSDLQYDVEDKSQFSNAITYKSRDFGGSKFEKKIRPNNFRDDRSQIPTLVRMKDIQLPIGGLTALEIPVNPDEEIVLTFKIQTKVSPEQLLAGKTALMASIG